MTAATTVAPARSRVDVAGAVAAQFSQAAGSFLLQVLAARLLGKEGLAVFAVLSGLVVLATAVSGFSAAFCSAACGSPKSLIRVRAPK